MGIISRGFSGRRSEADAKLPPGQYLTTDFPVLSAGPTPHIPLDQEAVQVRRDCEVRSVAGSCGALNKLIADVTWPSNLAPTSLHV